MRALSRVTLASAARVLCRLPTALVLLGALVVAGTQGVPLPVVVPLAGLVVAVLVVVAARRALRRGAAQIDTILREELDPDAND